MTKHTGILASLLALGLVSSGCANSGFTGSGNKKKIEATPEKKPAPAPAAEPAKDDQLGQSKPGEETTPVVAPSTTANNDVVAPTAPVEPVAPVQPVQPVQPAVQPPVVQPPVQPAAQPTAPPAAAGTNPTSDKYVGNLEFRAHLFGNMEHGLHALDIDVYAILKDGSGKIVAAGLMTPAAICRGKSIGGMGYPMHQLKVGLQYAPGIETGAVKSGSGTLSICPVDGASGLDALTCGSRQSQSPFDEGGGSRPYFWKDKAVSFAVTGDTITINNGNPGLGLQDGIQDGLSAFHPYVGGCGGKTSHFADYNSPIVLDLNRDEKLDLLDVWAAKKPLDFDLRGNGKKIHTGWVQKQDGLLALDVDGNGRIDSGRELFGEHSHSLVKMDEWSMRNFDNGFKALGQYDDNQDGTIDAQDKVFAKLVVWQDKNEDGVTQKGELKSLSEHAIASVSLAYWRTGTPGQNNFEKIANNEVRLRSTFKTKDGKTLPMADVWFAQKLDVAATGH